MITVRLLTRADADQMRTWGRHDDPRLFQYNYAEMSKEDLDYWFKRKQRRFFYKIFGVFNDKQVLLGFITLKRINYLFRSAFIGIVFNPSCLGQGYGTLALKQLVTTTFKTTLLRTLYLEVARFNERAIRCYIKCGFEAEHTRLKLYESQEYAYAVIEADKGFKMKDGLLYTEILRMAVKK